MATNETAPSELEKRNIRRLSGEESNRISKECLRTALIQLLGEKDFQKISVTELVRRAGVSRATFYRNYGSMEALLEEIVDQVSLDMRSLLQAIETSEDVYQSALHLFRKLRENDSIIRSMVSFRLPLGAVLSLPPLTERGAPPADVKTHYWHLAFEGAVSNIVKGWVVNGMGQSPEEMAEICATLASEVRSRLAGAD